MMMRKKLFRRISIIVSLLAVVSLLSILTASPIVAATVPVIANLDGDSVTFTENAGAIQLDAGGNATVTDDVQDYTGGNVTLTLTNSTASDFLRVDGTNVTSGGDAVIAAGETILVSGTDIGTVDGALDGQGGHNLVITLNANATDGLLTTLLQNLYFNNTSENPSVTARTVAVTVADNTDGASLASNVTVNITAVNDPPVVGNLDGDSVDVIAAGNAVAINQDSDATVTDVDSLDFNGGNLTIAQATGTANGNFSVDGAIVTSGGDATIAAGEAIRHVVDAVDIGTVAAAPNDGQGGNDLIITFNANATPARVQTLVRNLTYAAPSGLGARTFNLTIDDNDGDTHVSVAATFTVTVVSVEMGLEGGGNPIADGGTHSFGYNVINTSTDITFTIQNTGDSNLTLTTPIAIAGADAGQFSIQLQPVSPVAAAGTTTFTVRFTPTTTGAKTATISIANNDSNENPYDLTITGFGYLTSGGTGSAVPSIATNIFGTPGSFLTDSQGTLLTTVTATSADGNTTISIPAGTQCLDEYGSPLTTITTVVVTPPAPPANANVIGLAYDFEPDGATFDPAFTITWSYDPDNLPEGVAAEDLVIAYYNEATGQWVELVCTVDTVNHTITAVIADFTTFAVLGSPQPAVFAVSGLNISPAESEPGEAVTVSVAVANTGGTAGDYAVTLKVNGVAMDATTVTLDAGGTGTVTFTLSDQPEGSYAVDVNGLAGSYTVAAPPAEPEPTTPAPTEEPTTAPTTVATTEPTTPPTDTPATTPTATTPPEDEAEPFNSWWIIILVGGAIIIGVLIWILTRSRR